MKIIILGLILQGSLKSVPSYEGNSVTISTSEVQLAVKYVETKRLDRNTILSTIVLPF